MVDNVAQLVQLSLIRMLPEERGAMLCYPLPEHHASGFEQAGRIVLFCGEHSLHGVGQLQVVQPGGHSVIKDIPPSDFQERTAFAAIAFVNSLYVAWDQLSPLQRLEQQRALLVGEMKHAEKELRIATQVEVSADDDALAPSDRWDIVGLECLVENLARIQLKIETLDTAIACFK